MISKKKKQTLIKKSRLHETDTGSSAIQAAVLAERIKELTEHLKKHRQDEHSRRGLLKMVADRRSHLKYIEKQKKAGTKSK